MKKIIRLTERDLARIVKQVVNEQTVKTVTMKLDCDKETIEGLSLSSEQTKSFCWSGRFGQPGPGATKNQQPVGTGTKNQQPVGTGTKNQQPSGGRF